MLAMMFVPTYVKSANVVVSNMSNTGRGIGKTSIYTVKINGYNNLYCVRGGATLKSGMQLSDDGVSLYTTTGEVVKDSSAIQWILDNMYLTEGTDANTQKVMRQNLINAALSMRCHAPPQIHTIHGYVFPSPSSG